MAATVNRIGGQNDRSSHPLSTPLWKARWQPPERCQTTNAGSF